jgi:hypothetical protein
MRFTYFEDKTYLIEFELNKVGYRVYNLNLKGQDMSIEESIFLARVAE